MKPPEDTARAIRDRRYKYVVGNPPYIRAERLKIPTKWSEYYKKVATGKKDVSYYFLCRTINGGDHATAVIPPWLEDEGKMGYIISFGLADSKAALALRQILLRNRLLELVDLEPLSNEVFTSGIATSRSTVAPILVIGSRTRKDSDYDVRVRVATRQSCLTAQSVDLELSSSSFIPKSVFSDTAINPFQQFTTKIHADDLSILKKLLANKVLDDFDASIQVGVQTGLRSR